MILEDIEIFLCLPSPSNQAEEGQRKEEVQLGKGRRKKEMARRRWKKEGQRKKEEVQLGKERRKKEIARRRQNGEEKRAKGSLGKKRMKRMIVTQVCFDVGTLVMEVKKEGDRFGGREV